MTPIPNDSEIINLIPDDLARNEQGFISLNQRHTLSQQRFAWIAGTTGFTLIIVALFAAVLLKLMFPSFARRGELFFWFPIGLFWLWLLRSSLPQWLHTNRELHEGNVAVIEGQAQSEMGFGVGLIQIPDYRIRIGGLNFKVSKHTFFQFKHREHYRVFYTPYSHVLLGGLQLVPLQPDRPRQSSSRLGKVGAVPTSDIPGRAVAVGQDPDFGSELVEPLTRHEREILRLLALGLSNKEIANELSLSINTIKMYTSQMYRKLGVRRRTEAAALARRLGVV